MFGEVMGAKKVMSSEQLAELTAIDPKRAKRFTYIQHLCATLSYRSELLMPGYPDGQRLPCPDRLIPKFEARSVFDAIQEQGVTSFITVPAIMPDLLFYARLWEDSDQDSE